MTTSYWNTTEGKSVPSGGANQLNTAASQGSELGNWLSKIPVVNTVYEKKGIFGVILGIIAVIVIIAILKKKK